jgi:phosphoribosylformimino-5-aminoimidazole carboxamide ribonucleotide (ProFAR) isomerase
MKLESLLQRLLFLSIKADNYNYNQPSENTKRLHNLTTQPMADIIVDIDLHEDQPSFEDWITDHDMQLKPLIVDGAVKGVIPAPREFRSE